MTGQGTRRGLERGLHQPTRREIQHHGRRKGISSLGIKAPKSDDPDIRYNWLLNELDSIWTSLRGGGSAKSSTYPRLKLSQGLDQWGRPDRIFDANSEIETDTTSVTYEQQPRGLWITGEEIGIAISSVSLNELAIGTNSTDIAALETNAETLWVPAEAWQYDPAAIAPATPAPGKASNRVYALDIPAGTTGIHIWSNVNDRAYWTDGSTVTARVFYSISTTPGGVAGVRLGSIGESYESGDALTSPTRLWSQQVTKDVETSIDTMYYWDIPEDTLVIADYDIMSLRLVWQRWHADYDYANTVSFFGILYTLV